MNNFDRDLEIVHENAAMLANAQDTDPAAFALIRRNGFGASDAAALLNVSPWVGLQDLIKQKCSTEVTEEELKIGRLPQVRMGVDLEPLILEKFEKWYGQTVEKPAAMYRMVNFPFITVNFDGITADGIPVECKTVSFFGEGKKDNPHWDHGAALIAPHDIRPTLQTPSVWSENYCKDQAKACGIPIYYYTQCQQQILAAGSDYCYLAALHTKDWTLRIYLVPRDELTIQKLLTNGYKAWNTIARRKNL